MNPISTSITLNDGREITLETGKLARQAHGSVVLKMNDTVLLATVVSNYEPKPDAAFFPLFVDYQEKFSSVGRIPGNFFRREGRLSDHEVLVSRLIDRAIRPLFPDNYMHETQVFVQMLSSDGEDLPDALAALAVSAALVTSDIPWKGPISEVRVARINGEFVINPTKSALKDADLDIIVAASENDVTMVEGEAQECSEADLIEAIKFGHETIKIQCQAQRRLAELVGEKASNKREVAAEDVNEELDSWVASFASEKIAEVAKGALDKIARKESLKAISEEMKEEVLEEKGEEFLDENWSYMKGAFDKLKKKVIRGLILDTGLRLDGRKSDEVRDIWTEIDYLPGTHGSAIFTRGETQSLASLVLGTKLDEQMVDNALEMRYEKFILHYNFPALSVGEVKPLRGPGRREVGHANLASRSIKQVLPDELPYTLRLISDILESNGSSSMATVCSGSLALMDGGIELKAPIAGIAMGLIAEGDKYAILSDILGDEDALGDMDFKVTGTDKGICGCQMDIKIDGLSYDWIAEALEQARNGRIHILNEMSKTISESREDIKPHAPRIKEIVIEKEFIGAVIGKGGEVIQKLQEETETVINIEEVDGKGIVTIASSNKDKIEEATAAIENIVFVPDVGGVFDAVVEEILPFGAVVGFRGKSGLLHISQISHSRIEKVEDHFAVGDELQVKLIDVDPRSGKYKLSRKALLPRPKREDRGDDKERGDRDRNHRGGNRHGRRDGDNRR